MPPKTVTLYRHKVTGHLTMTIQHDHGERREEYEAVKYVPKPPRGKSSS